MLLKKTHLLNKTKKFLKVLDEVSKNQKEISILKKEIEALTLAKKEYKEKISSLNNIVEELKSHNKVIVNDIVVISAALKDLYTILLKEYGYDEFSLIEFINSKKKKIDYH
tara:strand:- start:540 stop:872 length:333 start_codon:yes stop_codon:yes gene_type:complete